MDDKIDKDYKDKVKPNIRQEEFINSPLENLKLIGIPGGGKTTIIICKILKHYEKKEFINGNDFLVTSFSKKACEDFILKGTEISKGTKFSGIFNSGNIKTLHSLAGTIILSLLNKQCSSIQIAIISAINLIKDREKEELLKIKCLKNLKVIFVDEAQDLSQIQFELLDLLKKKLEINLIMVGDPNQSIYQFQNGSDKYLIEYNANSYYLEENNRSTPEITKFINYFRPWNTALPPMISKKENGPKPIIFCGTQDQICIRILNEIKNSKIPPENIAVIGPVKKSDKIDDMISVKFGLQRIANILTKNNIKFIKHYNDSTHDEDIGDIDLSSKKGYVNLHTIHGSKGLEFEKVIVINFHFKTFGKVPTLEEYNQFKYLWYVALSRSKKELTICCDNDKLCWNDLLNCPDKHYEVVGDDLNLKEPKFSGELPQSLKISEIITNKKMFDESILLKFYKDINFIENTEKFILINKKHLNTLFESNENKSLLINNTYLILQFLKAVFEYYYGLFHFSEIKFILEIKKFVKNILYINSKYKHLFSSFCIKCNLDSFSLTTVQKLKENKNKLNKHEKKLLEHIINKIPDQNKNKEFSLGIENDDIFMDANVVNKICDDIFEYENDFKLYWCIFKLCLFRYQYENEAKYLWKNKNEFKKVINLLNDYLKQIKKITPFLEFGNIFRVKCNHFNLKITGTIDMIKNDGTLVMMKFTETIDIIDKVKIFLWYHSYYKKWDKPMRVEILNFKTGLKHILQFDPLKTNLYFSSAIAVICKIKLFNMIFIYDLETTGLNVVHCEVIERYIHEYSHDIAFNQGVCKAKHKVPKEIIKLTGITQQEVNNGEDFNIFKNEVKSMLNICNKPIFIAHNGNVFDHQVLRFKDVLDNQCKFLDSRSIIRQLSKNKVGNETLSETYKIIIGKKYRGIAHRAKADVIMLLDIFKKLNLTEHDLIRMT